MSEARSRLVGMENPIATQAEEFVRAIASTIVTPHDRECLPCYLDRVMRDVSCDGSLRLARTYRDHRAPIATALEHRLMQRGGYCDCEVLMNVYQAKDDEVLPCVGVPVGSTKPCRLWR